MTSDSEDYFLPLQDQRVFGAGITRKRVPFVPAETKTEIASTIDRSGKKPGLGDRYLSIVLPQSQQTTTEGKQEVLDAGSPSDHVTTTSTTTTTICTVCALPVLEDNSSSAATRTPHASKLAHQVCLSHSHPPSHLARENMGLKYLSSYGWDPDARVGLGADGGGIRVPIKGRMKNDTVGLGVQDRGSQETVGRQRRQRRPQVVRKMNAKQIRKLELSERKRTMLLRDEFYGKDLKPYLETA